MEIKTQLNKPYTEKQRISFIVEQNHKLGYEIKETETALEAWGYTEEEKEQQEQMRISKLHLTRGDVFRGLLMAKGITRSQIRALIEGMSEETEEEKLAKEMALIDFDEALEYYRGVALIDTLGAALEITPEQMTRFFETGDYKALAGVKPESTCGEQDEQGELNDAAVTISDCTGGNELLPLEPTEEETHQNKENE